MSNEISPGVSWFDFLTVAASAGIFSAVIGGAFSGLQRRRESKRKAKLFALELNLIFDAYFRLCFDSAREMMVHLWSSGHDGTAVWKLPEPPNVSTGDLRWEDLNSDLSERAMALPIEATYRQRQIDAHLDVEPGDDPENPEIVVEHLVEVAKAAYRLAADIRREYRLDAVSFAELEFEKLVAFEQNNFRKI